MLIVRVVALLCVAHVLVSLRKAKMVYEKDHHIVFAVDSMEIQMMMMMTVVVPVRETPEYSTV